MMMAITDTDVNTVVNTNVDTNVDIDAQLRDAELRDALCRLAVEAKVGELVEVFEHPIFPIRPAFHSRVLDLQFAFGFGEAPKDFIPKNTKANKNKNKNRPMTPFEILVYIVGPHNLVDLVDYLRFVDGSKKAIKVAEAFEATFAQITYPCVD